MGSFFAGTNNINGVIYGNGKILVTQLQERRKANIIALDAENGKVAYSIPTDTDSFSEYKMPVIVGNEMYVMEGTNLVSINIDAGLQNWSVAAGRGERENMRDATPTASSNYIFLAAENGGIEIINNKDKSKLFIDSTETDMKSHEMVWDTSSKTLYVVSRSLARKFDQLTAYDPETRLEKWKISDNRVMHVVAANNIVYYSSGYQSAEHEMNALYELNAATGKINWTWKIPEVDATCSRIEDILITKEILFITIADFQHPSGTRTLAFSRKTHEIVWEINKVGHLSADSKRLYLEGHDSITAISLN